MDLYTKKFAVRLPTQFKMEEEERFKDFCNKFFWWKVADIRICDVSDNVILNIRHES